LSRDSTEQKEKQNNIHRQELPFDTAAAKEQRTKQKTPDLVGGEAGSLGESRVPFDGGIVGQARSEGASVEQRKQPLSQVLAARAETATGKHLGASQQPETQHNKTPSSH
jgi:hypothetical protein